MARRAKSLKTPDQGYGHRDHRSPKARNWRDKVVILKRQKLKEKIAKRTERELEVQEVKEQAFKQKHDTRI